MSIYEQEIFLDQTLGGKVHESVSVKDVVARLAEKREASFDEAVRSLEAETTELGFTSPLIPLVIHCVAEGIDITDLI